MVNLLTVGFSKGGNAATGEIGVSGTFFEFLSNFWPQAAAWVEATTAAELRSTLDLLDPVRSDVDNHATSSTNSQMV